MTKSSSPAPFIQAAARWLYAPDSPAVERVNDQVVERMTQADEAVMRDAAVAVTPRRASIPRAAH